MTDGIEYVEFPEGPKTAGDGKTTNRWFPKPPKPESQWIEAIKETFKRSDDSKEVPTIAAYMAGGTVEPEIDDEGIIEWTFDVGQESGATEFVKASAKYANKRISGH